MKNRLGTKGMNWGRAVLIFLPLFGTLSDKISGRLGRRYPLFLLITVFFMSLYRSPSAALVADCFIRPQRTMANAVLNLMAGIGAVLFGAAGSRLIITQGDIPVFTKCLWFVFISMLIATAIYFLFVRENRFVREVEMKNKELGLIDERTDTSDKSRTRLTKSERRSLLPGPGHILPRWASAC